MGVKGLWTIFSPYHETKSIEELRNKTVAVDLSCWVCEAQNVLNYSVQPRMYLRNLCFRTCYLLLMDVYPVFVLEGKAPELKYQTISNRNVVQFRGARPRKTQTAPLKDRSRFNHVINRCSELLRVMGLNCVQGSGEAEATCAYLNADGIVDGCISQDSDCFAYGAKIVYRNFSVAKNGGSVDVYDVEKINDSLNFGRNKIVALALLAGSDYSSGVSGVGGDLAVKFIKTQKDSEVLSRIRSWKTNTELFLKLEKELEDKNICTSCGHFGKVQSHTRKGCLECSMTEGCDSTLYRDKRNIMKNELTIRKKALEDENFPDESLIEEYLSRKDPQFGMDCVWNQPDVVGFVRFTKQYLGWEEQYAFEKIFPLLTRWQLLNFEKVNANPLKLKGFVCPKQIKKKRTLKDIRSYQIIWEDVSNSFMGLFSEDDLSAEDREKLWSTVEPAYLVEVSYPDLVNAFLEPKKKKPTKRKKDTAKTKKIPSKVRTIDSMFKKIVTNEAKKAQKSDDVGTNRAEIDIDTIIDLLENSNLESEEDDVCDLSDIVESIVQRKPIFTDEFKASLLISHDSETRRESKFFMTSKEDEDYFEMSFDKSVILIDSDSDDDKEN